MRWRPVAPNCRWRPAPAGLLRRSPGTGCWGRGRWWFCAGLAVYGLVGWRPLAALGRVCGWRAAAGATASPPQAATGGERLVQILALACGITARCCCSLLVRRPAGQLEAGYAQRRAEPLRHQHPAGAACRCARSSAPRAGPAQPAADDPGPPGGGQRRPVGPDDYTEDRARRLVDWTSTFLRYPPAGWQQRWKGSGIAEHAPVLGGAGPGPDAGLKMGRAGASIAGTPQRSAHHQPAQARPGLHAGELFVIAAGRSRAPGELHHQLLPARHTDGDFANRLVAAFPNFPP